MKRKRSLIAQARNIMCGGARILGDVRAAQTGRIGRAYLQSAYWSIVVAAVYSAISRVGGINPKVVERAKELKIADFKGGACPVVFWDVFGEQGHPVRATVSEMGPLLLGRLVELNDAPEGVLSRKLHSHGLGACQQFSRGNSMSSA